MTLPASGPISLSQVDTELGHASNATISLGDAAVRALLGTASGPISMLASFGKSAQFIFTKSLTSNVQNYNLRNDMIASGYSGTGAFTVNLTIDSGVYVWSDSTSLPGFDTGALSGGTVNITNNGFIMGKGGAGAAASPGSPGGNAISLGTNASIINNSYIGGGGGGGYGAETWGGRGGGGGGAGGGAGGAISAVSSTYGRGGAGGAPGSKGENFAGNYTTYSGKYSYSYSGGYGGGRIFPGVGGSAFSPSTSFSGGAGGCGGQDGNMYGTDGGSAGNTGEDFIGSSNGSSYVSGGGGWGARGVCYPAQGGAGGAGGKAIALNGYSATRSGGGTTYGLVN